MFWFKRYAFLLIIGLIHFSAHGCGLKPLFWQNQIGIDTAAKLSRIEIKTSEKNENQILRTRLEASFRHHAPISEKASKKILEKKLRLIISVKITEQALLIRSDDKANRKNLFATATYRLVRGKNKAKNRKKLFSSKARALISYNSHASQFANIIARRDAQSRVLDQLTDIIKKQIVAFLRRQEEEKPKI